MKTYRSGIYEYLSDAEINRLAAITIDLVDVNNTNVPVDWGQCNYTYDEDEDIVKIWGPDGDLLAEVYDNLGLGIEHDMLAQFWINSLSNIPWLMAQLEYVSKIRMLEKMPRPLVMFLTGFVSAMFLLFFAGII